MLAHVTLNLMFAITVPGHAELVLKPVHAQESVEHTFNERFSIANSSKRLVQIKTIFESFKLLTAQCGPHLSTETLKAVGNTEWDMQHLGFANIPNSIEGTLLKQDYLIKKLEHELAVEKSKDGRVTAEILNNALKDYKRAENAFQKYWNSFGIGD